MFKKILGWAVAPLLMLASSVSHAALDITGATTDLTAAGTSMETIVAALFGLAIILVAYGWIKAALFR